MSAPEVIHQLELILPDEAGTRRLACDLSFIAGAGDLITLSGDLGAGKTTFARALIRTLAQDERLEVPSPTFTLIQTYDLPRFPVVHADLYRIENPDELAELGWEEAQADALVLAEWPDRAGEALASDRLDVELTMALDRDAAARRAKLVGHGNWAARLQRFHALQLFLIEAGWGEATRRPLQGDASSRRYERLWLGSQRAILMDAPRRPDGPPVKNGLPYSKLVHLAEDVSPFVAMAVGLREAGFSAPELKAADLDRGFLLIEDLGAGLVVDGDPPAPVAERYGVAVELLAQLHSTDLPETLYITQGRDYRLPTYDLEALLTEVELLLEWYIPHGGGSLSTPARNLFLTLWRMALGDLAGRAETWVLRDYHSPNLIWLPERHGTQRIGVIDFQDAVLGPAAYDVASLLQDARVTVPDELEMTLLGHYVRARKMRDASFDIGRFSRDYAVMGAQRATKILGIFARLDKRDGKPQYLRHIPRVWGYLNRCLAHPSLGMLASWYESNVPAPRLPQEGE